MNYRINDVHNVLLDFIDIENLSVQSDLDAARVVAAAAVRKLAEAECAEAKRLLDKKQYDDAVEHIYTAESLTRIADNIANNEVEG